MTLTATLLEQMSFDGMVDSLDKQVSDPRKALLLQNVYPQDPEFGAGVVGVPGFRLTSSTQLGSSGNRTTQRTYQFTQLDGTERTVGFVGGKMYTYDWGARGWTEVTLSGVSLNTSAKIFCTTFADKLVVNPNDGTNKMFTWDGTTFTSLTNSSTVFGQPVVHYAKLFGIKWAERSTFIWSEENDPTTGYEAGGFNNAWTLGQTDQEPLHVLYATNEALYYFRARSIGGISGSVTTNFTTTGTHDGVSETVGSISPAAIMAHGRNIYFLSARGRPHVIRPGLGVTPLWRAARETIAEIPQAQLSKAVAVDDTTTSHILFGVAEILQTNPTIHLAYRYNDDEPGRLSTFSGVWRGYTFQSFDMVKDGDLTPTIIHGSTDGYLYDHGQPTDALRDHALKSGTVGIEHIVEGTSLGYDTREDKIFDRMDVSLRAQNSLTGLVFSYTTPGGTSTLSALTIAGGFAVFGTAVFGTDVFAALGTEAHKALGLNGYGRWIRPKVVHQTAGEQFGFNGWTVEAFPEGLDPATT